MRDYLVANGNAAMEFMGPWNSGTIGGLTADGEVPEWLGWFPFPSVPGAAGDPRAALLSVVDARSLAYLMKSVTQDYSQYFNHRYQRCGTVWQGRYKSNGL